nr:TM2 domain-containing protein [Paenibacillus physcomitrellae]
MNYNMARKSQLDTRELLLLDSEVKRRGKNMIVAYILWYFLGIVGGHRFYMKRIGTAILQLILSLTVVGLIITGIWWIVDAFLVHLWVRDHNTEIEADVISQIELERGGRMSFHP